VKKRAVVMIKLRRKYSRYSSSINWRTSAQCLASDKNQLIWISEISGVKKFQSTIEGPIPLEINTSVQNPQV